MENLRGIDGKMIEREVKEGGSDVVGRNRDGLGKFRGAGRDRGQRESEG